MKLIFSTPLLRRSAIARTASLVLKELLARGHEVVVHRSEVAELHGEPIFEADCSIVSSWPTVDPADLVLVNVGDNYLFHGGILRPLCEARCIGLFHDFYLHNLFNGWLAANQEDAASRRSIIADVYGPSAAESTSRLENGELSLSDLATQLPMTEWIARWCRGAVVHSTFYRDRVDMACQGPVFVASLPWGTSTDLPQRLRDASDPFFIGTFGIINSNKRADAVIRAIGQSEVLRSCSTYRLVGMISEEERSRLEWEARSQQVSIEIMGAVTDAQFEQHLSSIDAICCLRQPVLEGASASAVEGMLSGRPVVVSDAGFYADLPSNLVFKVPPDNEPSIIAATLEQILQNPTQARSIGSLARAWASSHFTAACYVDVLEQAMLEVIDHLPLQDAASRIGRRLAMLGIALDDPAVTRIGAILADMCNGGVSGGKSVR